MSPNPVNLAGPVRGRTRLRVRVAGFRGGSRAGLPLTCTLTLATLQALRTLRARSVARPLTLSRRVCTSGRIRSRRPTLARRPGRSPPWSRPPGGPSVADRVLGRPEVGRIRGCNCYGTMRRGRRENGHAHRRPHAHLMHMMGLGRRMIRGGVNQRMIQVAASGERAQRVGWLFSSCSTCTYHDLLSLSCVLHSLLSFLRSLLFFPLLSPVQVTP